MKMAQIGFTAGKGKWGGAQTVVYEYIKNFQAKGHKVQCFFTSFQGDSHIEKINGVEIQPLCSDKPNFGLDRDIELVHFHRSTKNQMPILKYCKEVSLPYIVTIHAIGTRFRNDKDGEKER